MMKLKMKSKKAQSEVITTVLLILIALAGIAVVSVFIIGMVKDRLGSTECFKTVGQLSLNLDEGMTYYDSATSTVFVSVDRKQENFNLTGMLVSVKSDSSAKAFKVKFIGSDTGVSMYQSPASPIVLPGLGERRTYEISVAGAGLGTIKKVAIAPIIGKDKQCDAVDEREISVK